MNLKKFLFFLFILCALSYTYFHYIIPRKSHQEEATVREKKILPLTDTQVINYLSIEYDDTTLIFERQDQDWVLTAPVRDKADGFIVEGIVSTLRLAEKERELTETTFDSTAIGLVPPRLRIGIGYTDKRRYLLLGDKTYVGTQHYARWEDANDVFLVSENFWNVFRKDVYAVRGKNLFTFDSMKLDAIEVVLAETDIMLEKIIQRDVGQWWLTRPIQNLARDKVVRAYGMDIRGIMVSSFHDEESLSNPNLQFSPSDNFIRISVDGIEDVLYIGAQSEDERFYYAYLESEGSVVKVAVDVIDKLQKDSDYFIDKRIHHFEADAVYEVMYSKVTRTVVFRREGVRWVQRQPETSAANEQLTSQLAEVIDFFTELEYEMILADEALMNLQLHDSDINFSLAFDLLTDEQTAEFICYVKDEMYIIKEKTDPNYFTIAPEKYDELNTLLKSFL